MMDGRFPVALLPVRIETRFAGSLLKVRIFPDEIFADTHEPGLTPAEGRDGAAYVAAIAAGAAAEADAWRSLVTRYTAPRAAYIARAVAAGVTDARAESWTRAAQATLPDSWVVRAYRGSLVYTARSKAVAQPLALTLSPAATDADRGPVSDDLTIDVALRWTIDFGVAQDVGMAVTIDLTKPDAPVPLLPPASPAAGVDLIVVVGVKDSLAPADGAAHLAALLRAHHYTRGLAFVPPGTPTSNTPLAPAGYPPADPGGATSFAVERGAPLVTPQSSPGTDGLLFAGALGLPTTDGEAVAVVEHVAGAGHDGDAAAAAMNDALWPATLGYFMEQMMAPAFDDATITKARSFAVTRLRAGGPLPAFRIGRVPYGLLPTVSLTRVPGDPYSHALRALRDGTFAPAAAAVPRVSAGSTDPDGDLLKVLASDASCRTLRLRTLLGPEVGFSASGFLGAAQLAFWQAQQAAKQAAAATVLAGVGINAHSRIGGLDAGAASELIGAPLVTSAPLSEVDGLEGAAGTGVNYIKWLVANATAHVDLIKNDALPGRERPLLYRILRHALLVELDRLAFVRLSATQVVTVADRPERELLGVNPAPQPVLTSYDRIGRAVVMAGFGGDIAPYLARLTTLAGLPTAELDRRFGETLDACSHRLDAWITALAGARLATLRSRANAQIGCHLGGFGWVENVRPAAPTADVGGFVHAPSAAHASAAAILRNGYLSRGGGGSPYAVDLSSARVRDALQLLDGTRQGEPLAALLGYRFERDLHERQLDDLIAPLRGHFPSVAGKTPEGAGTAGLVAADGVVDGLALLTAWRAKTSPFGGSSDLPALDATQLGAFHDALDALDRAVDGMTDLLTAESVFQAVRGNPMAATASLDAMGQGTMPPEPAVARTPLGGVSFTQRVAVVLGAAAPAPPGDWGALTPRAAAAPALDGWIGTLLGNPGDSTCVVTRSDGSTQGTTLAALGLRPIDVVALARTSPSGLGDGELDRRVLAAVGAAAGARVSYGDRANALLAVARAAGELLAAARPLAPADLVPAAASSSLDAAAAQELAGRARAALQTLGTTATALASTDAEALRAALRSAAGFGIPGAYPAADTDVSAVAAAIAPELAKRAAAAPALDATDPAALAAAATAALQSVFGRDFLVLPQLVAPALGPALTAGAAMVGDPHLPRQVLQQVARVRPGLARWRSMWLLAQSLGSRAPALEVAQQPAATVWAGRPGATFAPGTLSLVLHRPGAASPAQSFVGLVVDEWDETVPSAMQTTAVSFRHETPVAEAPQAVLLAVPATDASTWDPEELFDAVRDALALAKIRCVDGSRLDHLRPFLPAICLTGNTANESVSSDFLSAVVADAAVVAI